MNILLINHYAGSPEMGMEFRPYYFSREWVKMGHKVSILAADYSHLRRINPEVKGDFQKEVIDGIDYYWIKTGRYDGNGIKRALTMRQFVTKIKKRAKWIVDTLEPDVVICSSTYPLDTYAGQKIKRISKKPVKLVHEVHDMWPATLIEIGGMSKHNPFVMMIQAGENNAYKHSDKVIAMMPYSKDYMVEHGMAPEKFIHIPLGIDVSEWEERRPLSTEHRELLDSLRAQGRFIVGYFGGHAMSNALDVLIDAAELFSTDNSYAFVLVGDGVEKKRLASLVRGKKINNVHFLPPISKAEIPELTSTFDVIYIGCKKAEIDKEFGLCMNKMVDALMAGKPVVCSCSSTRTWVDECLCGITVPAENKEAVKVALEEIREYDDARKSQIKSSGPDYVKKELNISVLAQKVIDFVIE